MLRRVGVPILLAGLLLGVLLINKLGVLAPDIKPEIYLAPWRQVEALSRAWRESPKLGEPNFNVGLFPVAWVVGVVQSLGIGPDLSMRLLRWVLLLVGAWGASSLYRVVAGPRWSRLGQIAVAVLFIANPYMVTAGDFLANVLAAALLPWLAVFLLKATVHGGWRYPAAAALAFFAMSGMNVAVIPIIQLLCLPALLWFGHAGLGATWRMVALAAGKWVVLVGLLSAYWLVPSLAALRAGSHVTQFSESLDGIAGPSSFAEVMRGLGLWPLYGADMDGAWQPGFVSYLTNPAVVIASFLLPTVFVLSAQLVRGPARRLALLLVIPTVVLMVGIHPPAHPSPFGQALLWTFEYVPGAAAFRTTNKVGSVLVLGVALLLALAIPALVRRADRLVPRPLLASAAAGSLVLATWPAWSGGIYSLPLPVPDYWHEASSTIDEGPMDERVWFVPGVAQPQYSWSEDRPDDLNNALLARPSFVRVTLPESSPYGASLLAALDTGLQEETLPIGTLSAAARYLGVGDVLVRHDVRWDKADGARPLSVAMQVGWDPGLTFQGSYGDPGEGLVRTDAQSDLELTLPPLQHYRVDDARPLVRTESGVGVVVVDGDGWALASLVQAGLLPGEPPFLLAGSVEPSQVAEVLGSQSRIVLTDTNRRREVTPNRLTGAYGPLLAEGQDPGPSVTLFDADDQTVLRVEGGTATASQLRPAFGLDAASTPENAFDGDPTTAWSFGDFGTGLDQSITVHLDAPVAVDRIDLDIPPTAGQRIAAVQVRAGDQTRDATVPADGRVSVTFGPGHRSETVAVTITAIEGEGHNTLSIAEIHIPGVQVHRVARLPVGTVHSLQELDPAAASRLARTPVDVVLARVLGTVHTGDDEEARLNRDFTLPSSGDYRVYGLARPDIGASDELLDTLLGVTGDVAVTSSSRALGRTEVRGSRAFDRDPETGWAPGRDVTGEWLMATFAEPRRVSQIIVEQPHDAPGVITELDVLIDGEVATSAEVGPGRVRVPVPTQTASLVQLRITEHEGGTPTVTEVDIAGVAVATDTAEAASRCVALATLDGTPLRVRMIGGVEGDGPRLFAGCDPVRLSAGEHQLRQLPGWTPDSLVLRDARGEDATPGRAGPALRVDRVSSSMYRVAAEAAADPYLLVVGQNIHPDWRATMDGADLGPPVIVDGYAMGWWVQDLDRHVFEVEYVPQGLSDVAMAVSGGAVLLSAGLLFLPGRRVGAVPAPSTSLPHTQEGRVVRHSRRRRERLGWVLVVIGGWFFAGTLGLGAAALVAIWGILRPPAPRTYLRLATIAMALAPVAWIIGNLGRWGEVSPQLVLGNPAPSVLVIVSLILLIVGTWRDTEPQ